MPLAAITPPSLTDAPAVPDRSDANNFSARAIAQDTFVKNNNIPELRLVIANVAANANISQGNAAESATTATNSASSATSASLSSNAAAASAGAPLWVSGSTYAVGARTLSTLNGRLHRRLVAGAGTTDPALDLNNWAAINIGLIPLAVTPTTQQAVTGFAYALVNVAATTVTAPAQATPSEMFSVTICNGLLTNVIVWNGLNHKNLSDTTMVMDIDRTYYFIYINSTYGWQVL